MSKILFFKINKIISMHFSTKNYLKSNHYYTAREREGISFCSCLIVEDNFSEAWGEKRAVFTFNAVVLFVKAWSCQLKHTF
jgi:hypothetical protein